MNYIRDNSPNDYGIIELQDKIMEIMFFIHNLCVNHKIQYYIMGGTALGAIRHGGFIPWDDDLDIYMTPQNYEKFVHFFNLSKSEVYVLQEFGKVDSMITLAKIRMNGTTYIEPLYRNQKIHQGIFVDIFILHDTSGETIWRKKQYFWSKYIDVMDLAHRGYNRRKGIYKAVMFVFKHLPRNLLRRHAMRVIYRFDGKDCEYKFNYFGKARYENGIYKSTVFGEPQLIPFEKSTLYAPSEIRDFLSIRFGDYMKIPSRERIKWEQHAEVWDVNRNYTDYLIEERNK